MKISQTIKHLMKKWNVTSAWDFVAILIVFSLAGMSVVAVRKPFFSVIGITQETPFIIKFFCWLLIVFPSYQLGLLFFGFLLGQFRFFWEKEKQMIKAIQRLFSRKKISPNDSSENQKTYNIR